LVKLKRNVSREKKRKGGCTPLRKEKVEAKRATSTQKWEQTISLEEERGNYRMGGAEKEMSLMPKPHGWLACEPKKQRLMGRDQTAPKKQCTPCLKRHRKVHKQREGSCKSRTRATRAVSVGGRDTKGGKTKRSGCIPTKNQGRKHG